MDKEVKGACDAQVEQHCGVSRHAAALGHQVALELVHRAGSPELGLGLGLEEYFVFDSKSENRDRAVEAVLGLGLGLGLEEVLVRVRVRVRVRVLSRGGARVGVSRLVLGVVDCGVVQLGCMG